MLFGHQNDDTTQPAADPANDAIRNMNPLAVDPVTGISLPVATELDQPTVLNQPAAPTPVGLDLPAPPPPVAEPAFVEPATTAPEPPQPPTPEPTMPLDETPAPANPGPMPGSDDLIAIKQQALAQLSPLVDQLEQTPEEEFRTTMMMIQSTDNQSLIKKAYDAAQKITDEKSRAQALLDVINEINYFTMPKTE